MGGYNGEVKSTKRRRLNREGWRGEEVKNNDQKKTEGKLDKNLEFGLHLQKTEL